VGSVRGCPSQPAPMVGRVAMTVTSSEDFERGHGHRRGQQGTSTFLRWIGAVIVACALIAAVGWWLSDRVTASGDPGGSIMKQIAPVAFAIPGYGTSALPVVNEPTPSHPYLIMSEPRQDSCDGMAGTQGWTDVTMQAAFTYTQSSGSLSEQMGRRLAVLGRETSPVPPTPQDQMAWTKKLPSGAKATISVQEVLGSSSAWELVAQAPPAGKAASGC